MKFPHLAYGTPRKLPRAFDLPGRVVVLDIAFAANAGGATFDKVTKPFLDGLGDRLALWVDHHDHDRQPEFADDPRFVLCKKSDHGACPEMITPEMVEAAGEVDTICCHGDFDGLCAAAKWITGGREPYEGADADAHAIDTRLGRPSERAAVVDRALRARFRDDALKAEVVHYLVAGAPDLDFFQRIAGAAKEYDAIEAEAERLSVGYRVDDGYAICDATTRGGPYDKTTLLLLGQERAPISVVYDESTVTVAARFDSGIDLVELLDLDGGMPTRVSVGKKRLPDVLARLRRRASGARP